MKIRVAVILLLTSLLAGCKWALNEDDVYKADRQYAAPRGAIFLRDHDDEQVITIHDVTDFNYEVLNYDPAAGGKIEVYLGPKFLYEGPPAGEFSIGKEQVSNGTYEMKIVYSARMNSGSLASYYGLENGQLSRSWTLVIDLKK
jgi:hypothetical protein